LLSKTSVVMLPFVLLLCVWWQRSREIPSPNSQIPVPPRRDQIPSPKPPTRSTFGAWRLNPESFRGWNLEFGVWSFSSLLPFFLLALVFGLRSIWFQAHGAIAGETVQTENFWGRLAGAGWALWFYLGKAFLPLHLNLI